MQPGDRNISRPLGFATPGASQPLGPKRLTDGASTKVSLQIQKHNSHGILQVLWLSQHIKTPTNLSHFKALASLNISETFNYTQWRSMLVESSKTLKHLCIETYEETGDEPTSPLSFPNLQVLELQYPMLIFPAWMLVPETLKIWSSFTVVTRIFANLRANAHLCKS